MQVKLQMLSISGSGTARVSHPYIKVSTFVSYVDLRGNQPFFIDPYVRLLSLSQKATLTAHNPDMKTYITC